MNNIRTTSKQTHPHLLSQTPKNMLIRIDTPSTVAHLGESRHVRGNNVQTMLLGDIEDVKQMVQYSKIVLSDSRRQQKSPYRIVESDRMPLTFNYGSTRKVQYQTLRVQDHACFEEPDRDEELEGGIQIPLHLEQSRQSNHLSSRNDFDGFDSSREYYSKRSIEKGKLSIFEELERKRSMERKVKANLCSAKYRKKQAAQPTARHLNDRKYRELFGRNKELIKFKQNVINRSIDDKKGHHCRTESQFLSQSYDRLPMYLPYERSLSKQRKLKIQQKIGGSNPGKIKVKMNKPNLNQPSRYGQITRQLKPKQAMDNVSLDKGSSLQKSKEKARSEWLDLKLKVDKYDFVKKNLKEGELYRMFQYLRKSEIHRLKWVLFVVDEAYRKMK